MTVETLNAKLCADRRLNPYHRSDGNPQFGENLNLGRDEFGRDIFSETSEGCRISYANDAPCESVYAFETYGTNVILLNKGRYVTETRSYIERMG